MSFLSGIKKITYNTWLYKYLFIAYHYCFLSHGKETMKSFGNKNPDKTFYVIQTEGSSTGILAYYLQVLSDCAYAEANGYIPIVDMMRGANQYSSIGKIGNPWELFFQQPSAYSLEEAYSSRNVVISGWTYEKLLEEMEIGGRQSSLYSYSFQDRIKAYQEMHPAISISDSLRNIAESYVSNMITENTLGVFLRGTDYVATRPKGHFIQPSVTEVIRKIEEFQEKHLLKNVFLVTEDTAVENAIREAVSLPVDVIHQSAFEDYDYEKAEYLNQYLTEDEVYDNTMKYLIKCVCLSKCRYLVTSAASGSVFSLLIREQPPLDAYYFDLGKY